MFITRMIIIAAISVALHWFLGWQWTVLAGVLGGLMQGNKGWILGFLAVAIGWAVLVFVNQWQAPAEIGQLFDSMSTMMGNLPDFAFPALTILVGGITGMLGGIVGSLVAAFVRKK